MTLQLAYDFSLMQFYVNYVAMVSLRGKGGWNREALPWDPNAHLLNNICNMTGNL